jgi:tetratricopeptide (TPR) repeat protein
MKENLIQVKISLFAMILLAMALLLPASANCFTAMAQVDKTRMAPTDQVSLQVVVEGGQAEVDLSPIQDFKVVRSGTSESRSYTNGQWQHQVIYRYQLVPIKTGVLKIPPLNITQKKESLATKEIQILVSKTPVSENQPRQIFVQAHVGASDLVAGQQTVYTIKLYTALRFARASLKTPDFDSFAAQEIEQRKNYTQTVNGIPYQVTEIFYILQAQKPGRFEIDPAVIMADVIQRSGNDPMNSFLNGSFFSSARTRSIQVASNGVALEVRPLPAYTGDHPFSGLVGQFTIASAIDKPTLLAGESATLTLTIQGKGNIMDAGPPPLNLDPGRVKVYEDTPTEEMAATKNGFSGKKIFKHALVPLQAGTLVVPSFPLTYFDVIKGEYETIKTREIVLVTGAASTAAMDSRPGEALGGSAGPGGNNTDSAGQKQEVVMVNKDILDIKESISILSSTYQLAFPFFLLLVFVPGVLYGCLAVVLGFKTREKSNETLMTQRARQALKTAQKLAASGNPFLNHAQTGLVAAILAKGNKQGESLTCDEARQILMQTGTRAGVIDEVVTLLEKLDATRFGGGTQDNSKDLLSLGRVKQIIKQLCIILCCLGVFLYNPPPGHAKEATGALGVLHSAGDPADLPALPDLTGPFINGIKQYKAGEFKDAAASFETIAAGVVNPDLFYNIGNAYLKADDLGNAILWYERAKRLAPEDPDLLFNLAHANTLVKDKIDSPVTLTDILFFWQGLVPLKWLQTGAIVSSWLFFLWAGVQRFRQKSIFAGMGWWLISLLVVLSLVSGMEDYRGRAKNMAVIVQNTAAVRSGIMETSTKLFELHAGTRVQVKAHKNGYLKIRLAKGRIGWVKPGAAKVI